MSDLALHERLAALLGRTWRQGDRAWRLIDLLPEAGLLVLESVEAPPGIQLDQFGRPSHRAPDLRQIPIVESRAGGPGEEIEALLRDLESPRAG